MNTLRILLLALLVVLTGCADTLTAPEADRSDDFDLETLQEVEEEDAARSQFPADLQMEILVDAPRGVSKNGQTALVQVVHNAPDIRAFFVDIYVNGELAINNFRFRTATPFIELPTDVEIAVAPFYSRSVRQAIATFAFGLEAGEQYVVVAGGVLRQNRFNRNPDGLDVGFDLFPYAPARTAADDGVSVDLLAFHGSPDAPTVDVRARGVATLVDDIAFGDFQGYVSVPAGAYTLDVTTADGSVVAASFEADLSGLGGGAATVLASGYLTPPGFRFALIAALPDGTVIRLPKAEKAKGYADRDKDDDDEDDDDEEDDDEDDDDEEDD